MLAAPRSQRGRACVGAGVEAAFLQAGADARGGGACRWCAQGLLPVACCGRTREGADLAGVLQAEGAAEAALCTCGSCLATQDILWASAACTMSAKGRSLMALVREGRRVSAAQGLDKWLPHSKRARQGLFGGTDVASGNKVSEDGGNKSRRTWRPNVQKKRLWSEGLQESFRLNVTTRVLRTIDKYGGLDAYLLGATDRKLASLPGFAIREELRQLRQQGSLRLGHQEPPDGAKQAEQQEGRPAGDEGAPQQQ